MLQEERNVQTVLSLLHNSWQKQLKGSRFVLAVSLWAQFIMEVRAWHSEGNAGLHIGPTVWKERNSCGSKLIFSFLCYLEPWTRAQCSSTFRMSLLFFSLAVIEMPLLIFLLWFFSLCLFGSFPGMCALCCQRSERVSDPMVLDLLLGAGNQTQVI